MKEALKLAKPKLEDDLKRLYTSFELTDNPDINQLYLFGRQNLDYRAGKAREEMNWGEGKSISIEQKLATIELVEKWKMLSSTYPMKSFDLMVVLGAHKSSLQLRVNHAVDIASKLGGGTFDTALLSCFRDIHPKEGVDQVGVETEYDLVISLFQEAVGSSFISTFQSCWDDSAPGFETNVGEFALATVGLTGLMRTIVLGGSVPASGERATTISTLQTLKSFLEEWSSARLLFVTTSLHAPYQRLQINSLFDPSSSEVIGVAPTSVGPLTVDCPDSRFRIVLQEVCATIDWLYSLAQKKPA